MHVSYYKMHILGTTNNVSQTKFNFEHIFRPIYYFSRFAGLWPFSIIRNSTGKIQKARCGPCDILWMILVLGFNLTFALDAYIQLRKEQQKLVVHIRYIVESIFEICSFLFITIGIVLDVINRNRIVDILQKFNKFDHEVSQSPHFHSENCNLKFTIGFLLPCDTIIGIEIRCSLQLCARQPTCLATFYSTDVLDTDSFDF